MNLPNKRKEKIWIYQRKPHCFAFYVENLTPNSILKSGYLITNTLLFTLTQDDFRGPATHYDCLGLFISWKHYL